MHPAIARSANSYLPQIQHQPIPTPNVREMTQQNTTTAKRPRPLNESTGSISSTPKQPKINDHNTDSRRTAATSNQQQRRTLPMEQLKRAVSSNLPCFFVDFKQTSADQHLPSAFEARQIIEQHFIDHNVFIQKFSLVGWSGKSLKLGVNNKEDYMTLVTTDSWPTTVKNLSISVIKPKYVPDCFALVVRYVPHELEIETVVDEIKHTITSADNIKRIHYAYERKTNDFRFTVTDLKEYSAALEMGRIAICNHWLSITPFLSGNRMTYCTQCWEIGHMQDQCEVNVQRCRVCLEDTTKKEEHRCSNTAKCAQCDGQHHSLYSQCHFIKQYRADLKEDVKQAIESGRLKRNGVPTQQYYIPKKQDFPPINENNKSSPQEQQQRAWNRTTIDNIMSNEANTAKLLTVINESLVAMRESSNRVEAKLEQMDQKGNQTALDIELHQTTIVNLIENVQSLIEHVLWPVTAQVKPGIHKSSNGLEPMLRRLRGLKTTLREEFKTRRQQLVTPPIQDESALAVTNRVDPSITKNHE